MPELERRHAQELGAHNIRAAIRLYSASRIYTAAVAAGRHDVDLDGSLGGRPGTTEQREAGEWLLTAKPEQLEQRLSGTLSNTERRKTLFALDADYHEEKVRSSNFALAGRQGEAFALRSEMRKIAEILNTHDPSPDRLGNLRYAEYYQAVSGCCVSLLQADFDSAIGFSKKVLECSYFFVESEGFFPNFFADQIEIASFEIMVEAISAFKEKSFLKAAEHYQRWLIYNQGRSADGNAQYDGNLVHFAIALLLDKVSAGHSTREQWSRIDELLNARTRNVYRTTRALIDRVEAIKFNDISAGSTPAARAYASEIVDGISSNWRLLFISTRLEAADRAAGLEEEIVVQGFLDFFGILSEQNETWQTCVFQMIRNSMILKADFETRIAPVHPDELKRPYPELKSSFEIERLTDVDLVEYTHALIDTRLSRDINHFEKATKFWWDALKSTKVGQFDAAIQNFRTFLTILRALPHVLRITSCEEIDKESLHSKRYQLEAQRVGHYSPAQIKLTSRSPTAIGEFAYMRARWNRAHRPSLDLDKRAEPFLLSRVPSWMCTFEAWVRGQGDVPSERFLSWLAQFESRWRPTVLRLVTEFDFWTEETVRSTWKDIYRNQMPAELKVRGNLFVGLGHAGKSGPVQLYALQQALRLLSENERSFDFDEAFWMASVLDDQIPNGRNIVFVDDLIGTGKQAVEFLETAIARHPRLADCKIHVATLCAYAEGEQKVRGFLDKFGGSLFVGRRLDESRKAFSEVSKIWDCDADRIAAKTWCSNMGAALVRADGDRILRRDEKKLDPIRDSLGYRGSEALVAFHYNTPNNTLPIFWAEGNVAGEQWTALFPRQ